MATTYDRIAFVKIFDTLPDHFMVFRKHQHDTSTFRVCDPAVDGDEITRLRKLAIDHPDIMIGYPVAFMGALLEEQTNGNDHARDE